MSETFRLLHASDFHFYRRQHTIGLPDNLPALVAGQISLLGFTLLSSHDLTVADALAAFAYVNRAGLDAIVVSGDLATTGEVQDLSIAHEFVAGGPVAGDYHTAEGFPTLSAAGLPLMLLPGNHDRYGPSWETFAGGATAFDKVFGDYWTAGQGVQRLWRGQRGDAGLTLIGADFSVTTFDDAGMKIYGHLGRGHVRPDVMSALVAATQQARADDPNGAVVWVIHFEPDLTSDSPLLLYDPDGLLSAAAQSARPAAILCGHTHLASTRKDWAGIPGLVCLCGTTTQWFAPNGNFFQLIEVAVDPADPAAAAVTLRPFRYTQCDGQSGFFEDGKCPGQ